MEFRSLQESIDTSSSGGRLIFLIFASLAEFERDLIRERTKPGLEAARARGRTGGRPPSLSGDKLRTARKLYEQKDMTVAQIGEVLGVSCTTVYRALRKETGVLPTRQKNPRSPHNRALRQDDSRNLCQRLLTLTTPQKNSFELQKRSQTPCPLGCGYG